MGKHKKIKPKVNNSGQTAVALHPMSKKPGPVLVSANWKNLQKLLHEDDKKGKAPNPKKMSMSGKKLKSNVQIKRLNKGKIKPKIEEKSPSTAAPEIWFDDVDPELLDDKPCFGKNSLTNGDASTVENTLEKAGTFNGLTKAVAMDCEMVGVGEGGNDSILARVSLVNLMGHCIYDKFVKPTEAVTDYRTPVSGITPQDIKNGEEFSVVQKEVCDIIKGRILVGHALDNDLAVLFLSHSKSNIRDTSRFKKFRNMFGGRTPALKRLSKHLLGVSVQEGAHSSVQDAQAAMRLYTMHRQDWEREIKSKKSSAKLKKKLINSK